MGHFHTTIRGEGKTKQEAQRNAIDDFIHEEGTRHSVREVSPGKLIKRVAPFGVITKDARGHVIMADYTRRNESALQSEWLELWEFELHTHA